MQKTFSKNKGIPLLNHNSIMMSKTISNWWLLISIMNKHYQLTYLNFSNCLKNSFLIEIKLLPNACI